MVSRNHQNLSITIPQEYGLPKGLSKSPITTSPAMSNPAAAPSILPKDPFAIGDDQGTLHEIPLEDLAPPPPYSKSLSQSAPQHQHHHRIPPGLSTLTIVMHPELEEKYAGL